jgi:xanthine dehydrogenase YagS FAD-binding subunit
MKQFQYQRVTTSAEALHAGTIRGAKFLAGGTNLVDLIKYDVESPTTLIDITLLDLTQVSPEENGGVKIGALGFGIQIWQIIR